MTVTVPAPLTRYAVDQPANRRERLLTSTGRALHNERVSAPRRTAARARPVLPSAVLGLLLAVSGCGAGGPTIGQESDPASTQAVGTSDPAAPASAVDAEAPGAGSDETTRRSVDVTRRPTRDTTQRPTAGGTAPPTTGGTTGTTSPGASRMTTPGPSYSPYTMCPDITALKPTFSVAPLRFDPELGSDIVRLSFTYTNPEQHALFLMGSVGYVDSEGYESDLYSLPGGLVFDDVRLERGTHTIVVELEDVWGEATESIVYFTYWSLAGVGLDSSRPVPCEPSRGYSSH